MTPETLDNLRAARIPWVPGMVTTEGDRVAAIDGDYLDCWTNDKRRRLVRPERRIPDLRDRATFLLACDEVERRGVTRVEGEGLYLSPDSMRVLQRWEHAELRGHTIAALAQALRTSLPPRYHITGDGPYRVKDRETGAFVADGAVGSWGQGAEALAARLNVSTSKIKDPA